MESDCFRESLDSLAQSLIEASLSFDIWWEITNLETGSDFIIELDRYSLFLRQSLDAHFQRLIITLYRIFETNKKTTNIPNLIKELTETINQTWKKIVILRSNVYGHRSKKLLLSDSFNKANIKPNELELLIVRSQTLLRHLYLEVYNLDHAFNLESVSDTRALFQDLKKLR